MMAMCPFCGALIADGVGVCTECNMSISSSESNNQLNKDSSVASNVVGIIIVLAVLIIFFYAIFIMLNII